MTATTKALKYFDKTNICRYMGHFLIIFFLQLSIKKYYTNCMLKLMLYVCRCCPWFRSRCDHSLPTCITDLFPKEKKKVSNKYYAVLFLIYYSV